MDNHPERHNKWYWVSSVKDTKMVACATCGHIEAYNAEKHTNPADLDTWEEAYTF